MTPAKIDIVSATGLTIQKLGRTIQNDKASIIALLNANGYPTLDTATEDEVRRKTALAVKDSRKFNSDLSVLLASQKNAAGDYRNCAGCGGTCSQALSVSAAPSCIPKPSTLNASGKTMIMRMNAAGGFKNASGNLELTWAYIDQNGKDVYMDQDGKLYSDNGDGTFTKEDGTVIKNDGSPVNKTSVGLFDATTTKNVINSALSFWSASINQEANKTTQQNAIELAQIQLQQKNAEAAAAQAKSKNNWIVAVAVLGALAVVITVVYFMKKKKKAA